MIVFPNAKINLGLNVLSKREDGFHDIQSLMLPINLKDALEVIPDLNLKNYEFKNSGLPIDCPVEKNLIIKAYEMLKKDFNLPFVKIHLQKVIPMGAGLGGGSSDASFMLKLLNYLFELHLSDSHLCTYAERLGSDCPFFITNKPAKVLGTGNILSPLHYDFSKYELIIIKPDISQNTAEAYSEIVPNDNRSDIEDILSEALHNWKYLLVNDFELNAIKRYPIINDIKQEMYLNGAIYAGMTGSGTAIYGIFNKGEVPKLNRKTIRTNFI